MEEVNVPTSAAPAQGASASAAFSASSSAVEPASPSSSQPHPPHPSHPQPHPSKPQHHVPSALLPTPPASYSSSSRLASPPALTRHSDQGSSLHAATQQHGGPDLHQSNLVTSSSSTHDMHVDQIEEDDVEHGGVDDSQHDDLSNPSASSSMDEQDLDRKATGESRKRRTTTAITHRGPSSSSSAQKRTVVEESHSDSDSQSYSAVDSHLNSESDSEPDPESRHHSTSQATQARRHEPTGAALSTDVRRQSIHVAHRHSHTHSAHALPKDMGHDRTIDHSQEQDLLSTLAEVAQQMPRRVVPADRGSSMQYDSNATASESEGSLALEGIDSARQWPSMSESPWPSRTKQQGAHHRLSEIKASSGQREHSHHHQQHPYHSQRQHHHHHHPRTQPSMAVGSGMSNIAMSRPSRVKETITKDSAPRKWICKQVPVKTLGGEMMMPIWFSEEDMLLNEPVAPIELDTDRMDLDLMGAQPHGYHHHHHHHHHHHQLLAEDPQQAHSARQKRKMKLKDMALRESRDPQDFIDMPEPMDNKRRQLDPHAKEVKGKGLSKEHLRTEKRLKLLGDSGDSTAFRKDKSKKIRKEPRERSESHASTRDSTPTTPVDFGEPEYHHGSPPRQRRSQPDNSNLSSPSSGPRPRPFICEIEDCGKRFVDALQLERHIERHGPKELECDLDMCGKLFSSIMLLRRHQSMVHKRRSEKWESPPGTARPRSGRSRRREPRIVASGDVMEPAELERIQRTSAMEEDQLEDDDEDELEGGDGDDSMHYQDVKSSRESKALKTPKIRVNKEPKTPREHKPPRAYLPKRLAPKAEDQEGRIGLEEDAESMEQAHGSAEARALLQAAAPKPRPFRCTYDDCKKVFIDAIQLERHLERHGPKELECGIDGCRKRFSAQMLLRRHQSMVHKRRSPAVPVSATTGLRQQLKPTAASAGPAGASAVSAAYASPTSRLAVSTTAEEAAASSYDDRAPPHHSAVSRDEGESQY